MPKTGLGGLLRPNVFIVTDASGGASVEAHDMGVQRMQAAGAIPITWVAVAAEWQRDRAHEKTVAGFANILLKHGGTSSIAFAWAPTPREKPVMCCLVMGTIKMSLNTSPIRIGYCLFLTGPLAGNSRSSRRPGYFS